MEIRYDCLTYLQSLKEIHEIDSPDESDELEDDLLDKAWGLEPDSRLGCQAIIKDEDLVVEIPKYTINHASEDH